MKKALCLGIGLVTVLSGCRGSQGADRVRYGLSAMPKTLDPAALQDREGAMVATQIFEGLVEFLPEETGVVPCLATEWKISTDERSYLFLLREGVLFHDGTPFDAEAVRFSFERLLRSEPTEDPFDTPTASAFREVIQSVEALDPNTVRIGLKERYSPFLKDLARPCFGIVSPAAVQASGAEFGRHPVGTGPYRLVEHAADRIILERWERYRQTKIPLAGIGFIAGGTDGERVAALEAGELEITDLQDPEAVDRAAPGGIIVYATVDLSVIGLAINCATEPLSSLPVRQAIAHAVNKEDLVRRFMKGSAETAHGLLTSAMWGYVDRPEEPFRYDPERARALLAEASYPTGFETALAVPESDPHLRHGREIAEAIALDLEAVGIHARVESLETATFAEAVRDGLPGLSLRALHAPNGDADGFLAEFAGDAGGPNPCGNVAFDEVYRAVRETTDGDRRRALYGQLDAMVVQDAPWVFLAHPYQLTVADRGIGHFRPHPTGLHELKNVRFQ